MAVGCLSETNLSDEILTLSPEFLFLSRKSFVYFSNVKRDLSLMLNFFMFRLKFDRLGCRCYVDVKEDLSHGLFYYARISLGLEAAMPLEVPCFELRHC